MQLDKATTGDMMDLEYSDDYRLYRIENSEMPDESYVLCHDSISRILYRPHIAGKELQDRMAEVATLFMDAIGRKVLKGKKHQQITEVIFLAGGLYYQLNHGFKLKYNRILPQCFLGIKRQRIEGSEGEFTAVATYENFESLPDNGTVIIGDTIATGATLQKGIYHLLDAIQEKKYKLENLVICSLACSVNGAKLLKEVEARVKRESPNARVFLFVGEQLFHLMPDGTDLRLLYHDSVMPEETKKRILELYGEHLGKEMKCAVFDWGTRCKNPIKHYHEFMEFIHEIKRTKLDEKSRAVIEKMEKETKESLADFDRAL
jgi:hypothetical protein